MLIEQGLDRHRGRGTRRQRATLLGAKRNGAFHGVAEQIEVALIGVGFGALAHGGLGPMPVEIALGIERGHAAGSGAGHRLAVDMVLHVARGEHARDARRGCIALRATLG